jgi:hypothetical protein
MKHEIGAAMKADKQKLTAKVGNSIIAELAKRGCEGGIPAPERVVTEGGGDACQALLSDNGASAVSLLPNLETAR